jgi:hypothetical protein
MQKIKSKTENKIEKYQNKKKGDNSQLGQPGTKQPRPA